MNFRKFSSIAALSFIAASQAQAQDFYGSVAAGLFVPEKTQHQVGIASGAFNYKTGHAFQAALGYDLGNGLRSEIELGISDSEFKNFRSGVTTQALAGGDYDQLTLHLAGYYDFNAGGLSPYLGGGIGLTRADLDSYFVGAASAVGDRSTDFSAFGEAGVSIPITDRLSISPGVRYSWVGNNGGDFTAWTFRTALRFAF